MDAKKLFVVKVGVLFAWTGVFGAFAAPLTSGVPRRPQNLRRRV